MVALLLWNSLPFVACRAVPLMSVWAFNCSALGCNVIFIDVVLRNPWVIIVLACLLSKRLWDNLQVGLSGI